MIVSSIRDTQKQLNTLLQKRPDKIRSRNKARLGVLRECKKMRTLSIQPGLQKNKVNDIAETDGTEPSITESYLETPFDVLANSTSDWSWLDLGLNETNTLTSQYVPQSADHPAVCPWRPLTVVWLYRCEIPIFSRYSRTTCHRVLDSHSHRRSLSRHYSILNPTP